MNLITDTASPFQKIPVYDQKDSNICYAFSAAQMVDYQLIKEGALKRSVHPAWLALNYAIGRNKSGLDIGHTKEAIERLQEANNCDFEKVTNAFTAFAGTHDLLDSKIIAFIEKYADLKHSPAPSDIVTQHMFSELKKISQNPVKVVSRILSQVCSNRTPIQVPKVSRYNFTHLPDDKAFQNFLIQRLDANPTPISIAYCSRVWRDPSYDGIELTKTGIRDSLKKDCGYHESLVVGKKMAGDSCQLLIRNTWGDRWKAGNSKWKCLCKDRLSGQFVDDCTSSSHADENYSVEACWISSDVLSRNVGVITFME
jgi:hypothetical protein